MKTGRHDYSFRNQSYTATGRLFPTGNPAGTAPAVIDEGWEIVLPYSDSRLVRYFSHDLFTFLLDAFGLSLRVRFTADITAELSAPKGKLLLLTEGEGGMPPLSSEMAGAFRISVTGESVTIVGKTERGTAQGVYYLEDHMRLLGEAKLAREEGEHAPLFSPRMTHSGTELDTFPDEFLAAAAHAGMDAIIVYAGHPDSHLHGFPDPDALWPGTGRGCCDFANLVWRAAGYGLDVYVYSQMVCDRHPCDADAYEYYDASFGRLFREAPGLRGLILVGESFEFPSKDPNTCGVRAQKRPKEERRPSPGRYPSCDYPEMLALVRDVVRAYTPDADIVFWSYNFGWTPAAARLSLIERLPRDISYLVTFEVWERLSDESGRRFSVADYSISYPGPCRIFREEAEKARECGLRLYTMGNTGGRTWDTGGAPYLPTPQQWHKRYEGIREAAREYGLCGLMENHHYGWLPSPLTLAAKNAFMTGALPDGEMLERILRRDYGKGAAAAGEAFRLFSEGIACIIPSVIDQYGPFRAGPTYPLLFTQEKGDLSIPTEPWTWHPAGGIWKPLYPDDVFGDVDSSLLRLERVHRTVAAFGRGVRLLEEVVAAEGITYGSEPSRQLAVARFVWAGYATAENVMAWNIAKRLLFALDEGREIPRAEELFTAIGVSDRTPRGLADAMRAIAEDERGNVAEGLRAWEEDSSIGFEASMEYVFNDKAAAWKLAELDRSLALLEAFLEK